MGLMDKVKKILFDEEEVEIPVNTEKTNAEEEAKGFIDHGQSRVEKNEVEEVEVEEDIIKEIVIPSYEETEEVDLSTKKFNFPDQFDFDDTEIVGTRYAKENEEEKTSTESVYSRLDKLDFDQREHVPEKDYNSILKNASSVKKPFKVSPTISPVYGIIDKNYVSEPTPKKEVTSIPLKKRTFGPVSYNDDGTIVTPKRKSEITKEEIKEVNETISEMITDDIVETEEIKTSGIENEYIGNNNIEDAFESTSELNRINEMDKKYEEDIEIEETEEKKGKDSLVEENLDDTIETDLFNLIDSMYSSDESNENEEE